MISTKTKKTKLALAASGPPGPAKSAKANKASNASIRSRLANAFPRDHELTPAELHAMKSLGSRACKKVRDKLQPGTHPVDFVVRIAGEVHVGLDSDSGKAKTPSAAELIAILMEVLGEDVDVALFVLGEDVERKQVLPRACPKYLERAEELLKAISVQVPAPKRGAVTGNLKVEVVG